MTVYIYTKTYKNLCSSKNLYTNAYSDFIHNL